MGIDFVIEKVYNMFGYVEHLPGLASLRSVIESAGLQPSWLRRFMPAESWMPDPEISTVSKTPPTTGGKHNPYPEHERVYPMTLGIFPFHSIKANRSDVRVSSTSVRSSSASLRGKCAAGVAEMHLADRH